MTYAAAIVALVAVTMPAASATNFFVGNGVYFADNSAHYYAYVNLTGNGLIAAGQGVSAVNATDMNSYSDGSCKAATDVCAFDEAYTGSFWTTHDGLAQCQALVSSDKCDKWHVHFDLADIQHYTSFQRQALGCHEWGHTTGLQHYEGTTDCMFWNTTGRNEKVYVHSKTHLNSRY